MIGRYIAEPPGLPTDDEIAAALLLLDAPALAPAPPGLTPLAKLIAEYERSASLAMDAAAEDDAKGDRQASASANRMLAKEAGDTAVYLRTLQGMLRERQT